MILTAYHGYCDHPAGFTFGTDAKIDSRQFEKQFPPVVDGLISQQGFPQYLHATQ